MNLSAYNKQGSNYQTEQIKCISPSTQILGLTNQDMQFYISKYGDKGYDIMEMKSQRFKDESKYFMELIQPLLQENYQLKDTIINLTEALKLEKSLVLELTVEQHQDFDCQQLTMSELLDVLRGKYKKDGNTLADQQQQIDTLNQIRQKLLQEIEDTKQWKIQFIEDKQMEVEQKIKQYKESEAALSQQNNELIQSYNGLNMYVGQLQMNLATEQEIQVKMQLQMSEMNQKQIEIMKKLQTQEKEFIKEKNEIARVLNEQIHQLRCQHNQEINEINENTINRLQELKKVIVFKDEQIIEIEMSSSAQLSSARSELARIKTQYQQLEEQQMAIKKQELANLDMLSKVMTDKREKDQQNKHVIQQLDQKNHEISVLKLEILKQKSEYEQLEQKCTLKLQNYKTKYKEEVNAKVQECNLMLHQEKQKFQEDVKQLQENYKKEITTLDLQRTSLIREREEECDTLRDKIEDLEFVIKDIDNMWDFKYAKLQVEYVRLQQEMQLLQQQ